MAVEGEKDRPDFSMPKGYLNVTEENAGMPAKKIEWLWLEKEEKESIEQICYDGKVEFSISPGSSDDTITLHIHSTTTNDSPGLFLAEQQVKTLLKEYETTDLGCFDVTDLPSASLTWDITRYPETHLCQTYDNRMLIIGPGKEATDVHDSIAKTLPPAHTKKTAGQTTRRARELTGISDESPKLQSADVTSPVPSRSVPAEAAAPEVENCSICMDEVEDEERLECGHRFCRSCISSWRHQKPTCPQCGHIFGIITGNQPVHGQSMVDYTVRETLPGFEDDATCTGTICIEYQFNDGEQTDEHPHPGKKYRGTHRKAYLPNNPEGRSVLKLLKTAFERRLTFTVGRSSTSNRDDQITWNDIHHKTNKTGGVKRYGYPDPTYLHRVKEELASKGIK